jgi:hypothetical protein
MPVGILGAWERGYVAPKTEADLWKFPLRDFGVDFWSMVPVSGIEESGLVEFRDMRTALEIYREKFAIVFLDEKARDELADFRHPESAVYVFGRVGYNPAAELARPNDYGVRIATPAGAGLLWPHQCAALVLYHRSIQWP